MSVGMGPRACVIGHPIAQSRSPMLHGYWLRTLGIAGSYERVDVPLDQVPAFFAGFHAQGFTGCNVTAPNKEAALRAVARVEPAAAMIGAVNTVWTEDGVLVGGNTDVHGFVANLDDRAPGWDIGARQALLLGAGGATRAAIVALRGRGLSVTLANRTRENAEALAAYFNTLPGPVVSVAEWAALPAAMEAADLLVNATALGMAGKPPLSIDLASLPSRATVYDIVYVPLETDLLRQARARGLRAVDGLGMLLHQAVPGFTHWFQVTPRVTPELRQLLEDDIQQRVG